MKDSKIYSPFGTLIRQIYLMFRLRRQEQAFGQKNSRYNKLIHRLRQTTITITHLKTHRFLEALNIAEKWFRRNYNNILEDNLQTWISQLHSLQWNSATLPVKVMEGIAGAKVIRYFRRTHHNLVNEGINITLCRDSYIYKQTHWTLLYNIFNQTHTCHNHWG